MNLDPHLNGVSGGESRFVTWLIALAAAGLVFGVMIRLQPVTGANDASRWDTVWSLVNGKRYVIDEAPYSTIDKVRRDGHFYSSKPALMPTVLAGPAWLLQRMGIAVPQRSYIVVRFILALVNVFPFALFVILYGRLLERLAPTPVARLFCLLAAGFSTYLTAYSITLNNHTQAALSVFFALYCLVRILYDGRSEWYYFALCGLFTAWAVANEMVAIVFAAAVLGYLLRRVPRPALFFFVPVAAVLGAAYVYTTYLSTGGILPYYFYFNTDYYQYEGSYWRNPRGIDALHEAKWFYAFNLLLGHHGIFSLTPVFLIGFYGMVKEKALRLLNLAGLGLTAAMFVFYLLKTSNYGGVCQGARWLFWLIPFWLLGLAPVVETHIQSRRFRAFALVVLLVSVMSVGHALSGNVYGGRPGPWNASWLQILMRNAGWIPY